MTFPDRPVTGPPKVFSEARLVFFLLLSIFVLSSQGFDTSEGQYHYMVAHQILTHGSLGFAEPREGVFTVAPNGRTYASHEIGNTLFFLPVAAVNIVAEKVLAGRMDERRTGYFTGFLLSLMATVYIAMAAALLYSLLRLFFRQSMAAALSATLAFVFCTYVWNYSRNLFDGVLCLVFLTGAMLALMQFGRNRKIGLFVVGVALLGFGVITRLSMVLPIAAFAAYLAMIFWKDRAQLIRLALLGAAVLAPFAAWQMYYNHLRTGNPLLSPVQTAQYASNNGLTGNLLVGVAGLLLSPGKSIFLYFPLALISIVCFRHFSRRFPREAVFVGVLGLLWLLLHAKLVSWYGAWGWGPRHFITVAAVLALPACVSWEWMKENRWRRAVLLIALAWGALLSGSAIIGNWHFQLGLATVEGREPAMVWSLKNGQALDMIGAAAANLRRMLEGGPGPTIPGLSPVDRHSSDTVNVWMNSAAYQGIPLPALAAVALVLIGVAAYCWILLRELMRADAAARTQDAA